MDALFRLHAAAQALLARVDAMLANHGAPTGHPVVALLLRGGLLPGAAVASILAWEPEPLRERAGVLRAHRERCASVDSLLRPPSTWEGAAAATFAARLDTARGDHDTLAGNAATLAGYLDELADWMADGRARLAHALATAMTSTQCVILIAAGYPASGGVSPGSLLGGASPSGVPPSGGVSPGSLSGGASPSGVPPSGGVSPGSLPGGASPSGVPPSSSSSSGVPPGSTSAVGSLSGGAFAGGGASKPAVLGGGSSTGGVLSGGGNAAVGGAGLAAAAGGMGAGGALGDDASLRGSPGGDAFAGGSRGGDAFASGEWPLRVGLGGGSSASAAGVLSGGIPAGVPSFLIASLSPGGTLPTAVASAAADLGAELLAEAARFWEGALDITDAWTKRLDPITSPPGAVPGHRAWQPHPTGTLRVDL